MKKFRPLSWLFVLIVLLLGSGVALAEQSAIITIPSSQVIPHDKFVGAQVFKNEGTIKGDLFFLGQNISSTGTIEGDAIGMGQELSLSGNILGNIRAGGSTITISGRIGKNVNAFGGVVTLTENSIVEKNIITCGGQINIRGKIKGDTTICGGNTILNGEFFGDVDINNFNNNKYNNKYHKASLLVLPGAIIHGKLKFRGSTVKIEKGARVANFQWVKPKITPRQWQIHEVHKYIKKFIRLLFTTAAFFLLGLLLFKLFPVTVEKTAEFTGQKPWNITGYGLIALFSLIGAAVACIILLILSLIISPSFGLIFGLTAITGYTLMFFLAVIPATLWLGGLILKGRLLAHRLGIGLLVLNLGLFILDLLSNLPVMGSVFPALSFIIKLGVVLLGTGAILYAVKKLYLAAKKGENC